MNIVNLYLDKENDYVFEYNGRHYGFGYYDYCPYSDEDKYDIAREITLNPDYYSFSEREPSMLSLIAQIEVVG